MRRLFLYKILTIALLAALVLLFFFPPSADQPQADNFSAPNGLAASWQFILSLPSKTFYVLTILPIKVTSIAYNKTTGFFSLFINIKNLQIENAKLSLENKNLFAENVFLRELQIENEYLRNTLELKKNTPYGLIPARVIGKDPAVLSRSIIIDKGNKDGIEENMVVISAGKALLGQIKEVSAGHSQILPITDSNSSINIITQESRIDAILRGEYGLSLGLEFIPQDQEIQINESVITSGINDKFPRGILVGYIQEIYGEPNDPFKQARVRPEADINKAEWVYIIKSNIKY